MSKLFSINCSMAFSTDGDDEVFSVSFNCDDDLLDKSREFVVDSGER